MCKPSCWPGAKNRYLNSRSPSLFAAKNKMLVKHYTKLLIPLRNCSNTTTFANHCLQGFDSSAVLGLSFCVCIIIAHILPIAVLPFLWNNNHKKGVYLSCCKRFQVFFLLLWWNLTAALSSRKWWIFRFSWKALKKAVCCLQFRSINEHHPLADNPDRYFPVRERDMVMGVSWCTGGREEELGREWFHWANKRPLFVFVWYCFLFSIMKIVHFILKTERPTPREK